MNAQQPLEYLISRIKKQATQEPEYIGHYSYPQWVECFGIYKTLESGMINTGGDEKRVLKKLGDPYVRHIILIKGIQERVHALSGETIIVPRGDITLHDQKFGCLGDYHFIGEHGWVTSATEQYQEEKHESGFYREYGGPKSYHIGLDGKAIYPHRFKYVWDYVGIGNTEQIPYREIHGGNYDYFEGAFPIGVQGTGSPLSIRPLLYMVQKHTSYRARAITLDDQDVWIDESGEII